MRALSLATATLLAASSALAGLQNPSSKALQALADLTRPDGEKHLPVGYVPTSADEPQGDAASVGSGVPWQISPQSASTSSIEGLTQIIDGFEQELPAFHLLPADQSPPAALSPAQTLRGSSSSPAAAQAAQALGLQGAEQAGLLDAAEAALSYFSGSPPPSSALTQQSAADDVPAGTERKHGRLPSRSTFSPVNPPSFPLAVRGPYLSAWLPSGRDASATPPNVVGNGGYLYGQYPAFWTSSYGADGEYRLGWSGFLRVDNTTYQWMGNSFGTIVAAGPNATQLSAEYTSTRSIFAFSAGGVLFNVTFLSPVFPDDYLRQSIPMSYMQVSFDSSTTKHKSVQLYTEIDERWLSGHDYDFETYPFNMKFVNTNGTSMYLLERNSPQVYREFRQRAEWGQVAYGVKNTGGLSSRNNNNVVAQKEFLDTGKLTFDHGQVGGPDNSFAFAVNMSDPTASSDVLFAVGHFPTPYVNYVRKVPGTQKSSYQQDRYGYWTTKYPNTYDAVSFFLNDFDTAVAASDKLDTRIRKDALAAAGGGDSNSTTAAHYAAIVELSVRQALGALIFTVSQDGTGAYNGSDALIFLKEISSNGDMSTIDVIMPLMPLLTYLNPDLLRDLLLPTIIYDESGLYPNRWATHDLGTTPNGLGYNDGNDEPMQVENSGNMILMVYHWAQLTGKKKSKAFLDEHYAILKQWAEFLIEDSLVPTTQLSTDDFSGVLANQTNLALKGILGIASIGHIAEQIGRTSDAQRYANISQSYISKWADYALSKDKSHIKLAYQDDKSWGTLYNLYFDKLLNLRLVPRSIYDTLDKWYPSQFEEYGLPLDSRHNWTKSDWQMFAAACSASSKPRSLLIERLYSFVEDGKTDSPFTDLYETTTGDTPKQPDDPLIHFLARPVVGGHLALMTLAKAMEANNVSSYEYAPEFNNSAPDGGSNGSRKQKQKSEQQELAPGRANALRKQQIVFGARKNARNARVL